MTAPVGGKNPATRRASACELFEYRPAAAPAWQCFVVFRNPTSGRERTLVFQAQGASLDVSPPKRIVLDDGEGMVQAARLGIGIAQVPEVIVDDDIACGALVEVLADCRPPAVPISVVWPGNRLMPARVRIFVDALCARRHAPED